MAEEGEVPDPATRGTLANSALRTDSGALGVSWVGDRGLVGIGYSLFNSRQGVPGHETAHDAGDRKSAAQGKGVAGSVDLGVRPSPKKKSQHKHKSYRNI